MQSLITLITNVSTPKFVITYLLRKYKCKTIAELVKFLQDHADDKRVKYDVINLPRVEFSLVKDLQGLNKHLALASLTDKKPDELRSELIGMRNANRNLQREVETLKKQSTQNVKIGMISFKDLSFTKEGLTFIGYTLNISHTKGEWSKVESVRIPSYGMTETNFINFVMSLVRPRLNPNFNQRQVFTVGERKFDLQGYIDFYCLTLIYNGKQHGINILDNPKLPMKDYMEEVEKLSPDSEMKLKKLFYKTSSKWKFKDVIQVLTPKSSS